MLACDSSGTDRVATGYQDSTSASFQSDLRKARSDEDSFRSRRAVRAVGHSADE